MCCWRLFAATAAAPWGCGGVRCMFMAGCAGVPPPRPPIPARTHTPPSAVVSCVCPAATYLLIRRHPYLCLIASRGGTRVTLGGDHRCTPGRVASVMAGFGYYRDRFDPIGSIQFSSDRCRFSSVSARLGYDGCRFGSVLVGVCSHQCRFDSIRLRSCVCLTACVVM